MQETAEAKSVCPHARGCRLYPLFTMKSMLRLWQVTYCEGEHARCVRYQRSSLGEPVPDNLLPNGRILGGPK